MRIKTQRITNDRRQPPTYHTVKLHLLKKTTAMNIKINSGKNKRDKLVKRERERLMEGTSDRMTIEKLHNYQTYIPKTSHKKF